MPWQQGGCWLVIREATLFHSHSWEDPRVSHFISWPFCLSLLFHPYDFAKLALLHRVRYHQSSSYLVSVSSEANRGSILTSLLWYSNDTVGEIPSLSSISVYNIMSVPLCKFEPPNSFLSACWVEVGGYLGLFVCVLMPFSFVNTLNKMAYCNIRHLVGSCVQSALLMCYSKQYMKRDQNY